MAVRLQCREPNLAFGSVGRPLCRPDQGRRCRPHTASRAGEPGNFWTLSDNYAITPDKALIQALREAAKTGKFKAPTAIRSTAVHRETSAAELYDLQGRRVQQPAAGTVVVSRNGKHIAQ